jgi:hypothetical protein
MLTVKIRKGVLAACDLFGPSDLVQLRVKTNCLLGRDGTESRHVSRFSLQNEKEIKC